MNYRHAFHAGNHADVLKHVVLLALCDALIAKPAPLFALDTHAGAGVYRLDGEQALKTGEAAGGIGRLPAAAAAPPEIARYLAAVTACRAQTGELREEEASLLNHNLAHDTRIAVHARDGYAAMRALLPPKIGDTRFARGLVLIDPPYETQLDEFRTARAALECGLERWPQAVYMLWYPIKRRNALMPFYRSTATLQAKSALICELLVRPDDSQLRMNGSGLLILNAPWRFDNCLQSIVTALRKALGESGASARVEWLREAT
jgi:23S rRNA (adenine2030-N6)-methyltransferase